MRIFLSGFFSAVLLTVAIAQTSPPDDARVLALKARFQQGVALEQDNKLTEARTVFDGILAEDPTAVGSLYYSGLVSVRLEDFSRAVNYLNRYRAIRPHDFGALVLLIQSYQALLLADRVDDLRKELIALRQGPPLPGLTDAQSYVREKIQNPDDSLYLILEYFDETQPPRRIWEMKVITSGAVPPRQFALLPPPSGTTSPYRLVEYSTGKAFEEPYVVVRQSSIRPDYVTCRQWLISAAKN